MEMEHRDSAQVRAAQHVRESSYKGHQVQYHGTEVTKHVTKLLTWFNGLHSLFALHSGKVLTDQRICGEQHRVGALSEERALGHTLSATVEVLGTV